MVPVTGSTVAVLVNGERHEVAAGITVADVVGRWCPSSRGVAVARNREVVARSRWEATVVEPGDAIEIVTAVAGG